MAPRLRCRGACAREERAGDALDRVVVGPPLTQWLIDSRGVCTGVWCAPTPPGDTTRPGPAPTYDSTRVVLTAQDIVPW